MDRLNVTQGSLLDPGLLSEGEIKALYEILGVSYGRGERSRLQLLFS